MFPETATAEEYVGTWILKSRLKCPSKIGGLRDERLESGKSCLSLGSSSSESLDDPDPEAVTGRRGGGSLSPIPIVRVGGGGNDPNVFRSGGDVALGVVTAGCGIGSKDVFKRWGDVCSRVGFRAGSGGGARDD